MSNKSNSSQKKSQNIWAPIVLLVALLLTSCGAGQPKTYTIGIANETVTLSVVIETFKAEMAQLGYVEGENVSYILSQDILGTDPQVNEAEVRNLMAQEVDLLLTLGTAPAIAAKNVVGGTDMPVVFAPVLNPLREGIVTDISHPGGNVTGVQSFSPGPKALEWLLKIAPDTKQVYVPYNPADQVALTSTKPLPEAAANLGVELILDEVGNGDEAMAAIQALPEDSAMLLIISPSLNQSREPMLELATDLGIPPGGTTSQSEDQLLISYTNSLPQAGKQAAALVDKIFKGINPGDLPVESAETVLTINLKIAKALGINIPDSIVSQAENIIR